jgi:hypothetical protein
MVWARLYFCFSLRTGFVPSLARDSRKHFPTSFFLGGEGFKFVVARILRSQITVYHIFFCLITFHAFRGFFRWTTSLFLTGS